MNPLAAHRIQRQVRDGQLKCYVGVFHGLVLEMVTPRWQAIGHGADDGGNVQAQKN